MLIGFGFKKCIMSMTVQRIFVDLSRKGLALRKWNTIHTGSILLILMDAVLPRPAWRAKPHCSAKPLQQPPTSAAFGLENHNCRSLSISLADVRPRSDVSPGMASDRSLYLSNSHCHNDRSSDLSWPRATLTDRKLPRPIICNLLRITVPTFTGWSKDPPSMSYLSSLESSGTQLNIKRAFESYSVILLTVQTHIYWVCVRLLSSVTIHH